MTTRYRHRSDTRVSVLAFLVLPLAVIVAGCDTKPRPAFNVPRARTMAAPSPGETTDTTGATVSPAPQAPTKVIEVGGFRGRCDSQLSAVTDGSLLVLTGRAGTRTYRLAAVAVPADVRTEANEHMRHWLEGETLGVDLEKAAPGVDGAVYIYRCSDHAMLNADLVREGLALPNDSLSKHKDALGKASVEAMTSQQGIWRNSAQ